MRKSILISSLVLALVALVVGASMLHQRAQASWPAQDQADGGLVLRSARRAQVSAPPKLKRQSRVAPDLYPDPGTVYAPRFEVFGIDQDGRDVVIEAQASLLSRKERIVRPYVQVGVLESSDTVDADTIWVFEYKGDSIELKRGLRHDIPLDWRFPLLPGLYRVRVGLWDDNFNGFMPMRAHEFTME